MYKEKATDDQLKIMDKKAIVEKYKDEVMKRIKEQREAEFIKVAIIELSDKLDEKLHTSKIF